MENLIGTRYGEALYEAGRDENCLDSLYNDVCLVQQMFEENGDFFKVMCVPTIPKSEKGQLLDMVFQGNVGVLTRNFLHLLVDRSRLQRWRTPSPGSPGFTGRRRASAAWWSPPPCR